jgi:hypothetical protein
MDYLGPVGDAPPLTEEEFKSNLRQLLEQQLRAHMQGQLAPAPPEAVIAEIEEHPDYEILLVREEKQSRILILPNDESEFDLMREAIIDEHDCMHGLDEVTVENKKCLILDEDTDEKYLFNLARDVGKNFHRRRMDLHIWGND